MTITISEIKNKLLRNNAVREDKDGDGKLNSQEFNSLFERLSTGGKLMNIIAPIGKVSTGILGGVSCVTGIASIVNKMPKLALKSGLGGLLFYGVYKGISMMQDSEKEALKELEMLKANMETTDQNNIHNLEVES